MKKILILITFYLLLATSFIFAAFDVSLNIDKQNLDINDTLNVSIEISSTDSVNYSVEDINGLDNFDIIGQSKSTKISSINGNTSTITEINLALKAKKSGTFTLGPITLSENGITKEYADTKSVIITGEKLFIGNESNFGITSSGSQSGTGDKNTSTGTVNNNLQNNLYEDAKTQKQEVKDLQGNEMKDIYDIKKNFYGLPINLIWSLFYILFFVIVYYLYTLYEKNKDKLKKTVIKGQEIKLEKKEIDFTKLILDIEKQYIGEAKEIFYAKLGKVVRLYLDKKVRLGLSSKTLKEIKGKVSGNLYSLIEKIYFPEYDNKDDSLEQREEILKIMKKLLK